MPENLTAVALLSTQTIEQNGSVEAAGHSVDPHKLLEGKLIRLDDS